MRSNVFIFRTSNPTCQWHMPHRALAVIFVVLVRHWIASIWHLLLSKNYLSNKIHTPRTCKLVINNFSQFSDQNSIKCKFQINSISEYGKPAPPIPPTVQRRGECEWRSFQKCQLCTNDTHYTRHRSFFTLLLIAWQSISISTSTYSNLNCFFVFVSNSWYWYWAICIYRIDAVVCQRNSRNYWYPAASSTSCALAICAQKNRTTIWRHWPMMFTLCAAISMKWVAWLNKCISIIT